MRVKKNMMLSHVSQELHHYIAKVMSWNLDKMRDNDFFFAIGLPCSLIYNNQRISSANGLIHSVFFDL